MFKEDGSIVQLNDILHNLAGEELKWSVLYFEGVGKAPNSLSMEDFEEKIQSEKMGYVMSWEDLNEFSRCLEQTFHCVIVGYYTDEYFDKNKILNGDMRGCEVMIDAFDSEEWEIKTINKQINHN